MSPVVGFVPSKDRRYTPSRLRLQGWTIGDGTSSEGYRLEDFFGWQENHQGREYLGIDKHGIEPIVLWRQG